MIDLTEDQFKRLKSLKPAIAYTAEEVEFLLEMTKKYVDEHQRVCTSCSSSIQDLKQKLFGWLNENEQIIINELAAQQQVADYTQDND